MRRGNQDGKLERPSTDHRCRRRGDGERMDCISRDFSIANMVQADCILTSEDNNI
jgi:hypothetical protein